MADALAAAAPMAQQLLGWVEKLAIESPFESDDINKVVQLAGAYRFGVQQTKEMTQALVDSAAAGNLQGPALESAVRALGQIQAKGKVSAEELNQLNESGFGTISTLERLGVTLDDVAKGVVSSNEFITAFIQQISEESEGAAQRTMNSWSGLASTLSSMANTGLREFFTGLLEPMRPLLEALGNAASADGFREGLRGLGEMIGSFLSPAIEFLTGQLQGLPAFFEQASQFIQQFRDEMSSMTAGDLMAQLPGALDQISKNLNQVLGTLAKAHEGTIANLEGQIAKAGEAMGQKMAEIAQKYGPKIAEINERFDKSIADLQERVADSNERFAEETADQAEAYAKRRAGIEKQIAKATEGLEERLTDLKKDHQRRRHELATSLLTAESEEQYLQIQEQIKNENEKYDEQKGKAKKSASEQVSELRDQLKEAEQEYAKEQAKRQKRHGEELADLRKAIAEQDTERAKQIAKVNEERAKEEQAVRDAYNQQVADLQARIDQENALYAQAVAEQKALAAQAAAETQASFEQRAGAMGQGPAAELAGWVKWLKEQFDALSVSVGDFITKYATPLQGVLLGIGAVILGGGIIAALTTLAGLLTGIGLPIAAIVAGIALLFTAWQENWFGIQQKTQAVLDFLQPYWERLQSVFSQFIDLLIPRLQEVWATLTETWNTQVGPALTQLWESFEKLLGSFGLTIDKGSIMEGVLMAVKLPLIGILAIVETLNPIIEAFGTGLETVIGIAEGFIEKLNGIKSAWESMGPVIDGLAAKLPSFGEAAKAAWDLIPPGFKPGSPTPLEVGFRGIGDAINKMPDLASAFTLPTPAAGSLAGAVGGAQYINMTQHNNYPQAPVGYDRESILNQVNQNTLELFAKVFKSQG